MDVPALIERARAGDGAASILLASEAGSGSIEVQRAIISANICRPEGADLDDLGRVEILSRMVAANGDDSDVRQLAAILWSIAVQGRAAGWTDSGGAYASEALWIMRDLADAGDGQALDMLNDLGRDFPWILAEVERWRRPVTEFILVDGPPPIVRNFEQLPPSPGLSGRIADAWWSVVWAIRFRWWNVKDWFQGVGR
jgi:hypothetical protein